MTVKSWQNAAATYARQQAPNEMCGLVVDGKFWACRNIHPQPEYHFELSPEDYLAAQKAGEIQAVVHSHVNVSANPSEADKLVCEKTKLPWYIIGLPDEVWAEYQPTGYELPLEGRPFIHGIIDCYTLVQDALRTLYNVDLPDFHRYDGWWEDDRPENLYLDHLEEAGFVEADMDDVQPGDMLLMTLASNKPNHAAIYLGDGMMIHHPPGQLSGKTKFAGYWQDIHFMTCRHKELMDA